MSQADPKELLHRRELLRRAAWLLGGAVSAPAALAILQGCGRKEGGEATAAAAWKPVLLTDNEVAVVSAIADILIPRTDTSGALDAGVPRFIDDALAAVYGASDQARFKAGCAAFEAAAREAGGDFLRQDAAPRAAFVKRQLEAALEQKAGEKPFILMTRELTLLGFFTSQVGITENMEYVAVPAAYHGCVSLSQLKKHVYWE